MFILNVFSYVHRKNQELLNTTEVSLQILHHEDVPSKFIVSFFIKCRKKQNAVVIANGSSFPIHRVRPIKQAVSYIMSLPVADPHRLLQTPPHILTAELYSFYWIQDQGLHS